MDEQKKKKGKNSFYIRTSFSDFFVFVFFPPLNYNLHTLHFKLAMSFLFLFENVHKNTNVSKFVPFIQYTNHQSKAAKKKNTQTNKQIRNNQTQNRCSFWT